MIDKTGLGSSAFRFGLPALGRFSQRVQRRKRACPLAMYYMPPCSQRVQRRKRAHGPLQDSLGSLAFGFGRASETVSDTSTGSLTHQGPYRHLKRGEI